MSSAPSVGAWVQGLAEAYLDNCVTLQVMRQGEVRKCRELTE